MQVGKLYFLNDEYLEQNNLSLNKGPGHDRPFFCAYEDKFYPDIKWMIPLSSQVEHYEEIHDRRMQMTGNCDGIDFVYLHNRRNVARINAAFPVIDKHVKNIYINATSGKDETLKRADQYRITTKLTKLIKLQGRGYNVFYNDVQEMRKALIQDLQLTQEEGNENGVNEDLCLDDSTLHI